MQLFLLGSRGNKPEASSFIEAIKDWNELLNLELRISDESGFYSDLVEFLTPHSRKNFESKYAERLLLPKLSRITLGRERTLATDGENTISANLVKDLVAARSSSGRGTPPATLTTGDLSQADHLPQRALFVPVRTTAPINTLTINVPLEGDEETFSWLEKNVPSLKIKHRIAPKVSR